jgi:hypothetical protein
MRFSHLEAAVVWERGRSVGMAVDLLDVGRMLDF